MAPEVTGVCAGMVGAPAACIDGLRIVAPVPTINAGRTPTTSGGGGDCGEGDALR